MYPILGRYGPFFLFSFTVVVALGVASAIGLAAWRARRRMIAVPDWLDGVLTALLIGLLGGRAGFVWREWLYFVERPSAIFQLQQGGLSYHSALLAGLIGLWGWCRWRKRPFLITVDLLAPGLALASAFGWAACWLDGCGYGREAIPGSWWAADLPDKLGIYAWRYQTQVIGMVLSLFVFILVLAWPRQRPSGWLFAFTLCTLSLGRAGLSLLRGDPALHIGMVRVDTLLDTTLALLSLILLQYLKMNRQNKIVNRKS